MQKKMLQINWRFTMMHMEILDIFVRVYIAISAVNFKNRKYYLWTLQNLHINGHIDNIWAL